MNERHAQVAKEHIRVNNRKVNNPNFRRSSFSYPPPSPSKPSPANGDPLRNVPDCAPTLRPVVDYPQKVLRNFMENGVPHRERHGEEEARLSLELEIDESIKSLLRQVSFDKLNKNCNQTVDVTLIQQTTSPMQGTVSLGMDEVWNLIDKVGSKGTKETCSNNNEYPEDKELLEYLTDYAPAERSDLFAQGVVPPKYQQVYTTPQQTFNDIRQKLPCMAHSPMQMEDIDKPGTPCLCQHCGMVGVLVESQKRPAIPHAPNPKFSPQPPRSVVPGKPPTKINRRIIDLRSKSKSETNLILLKELTTKIATLEERLNEHEEKTVKKDYFKFVIHKLLTQYSNKINELRTAAFCTNKPNINTATQYSKKQAFMKTESCEKSEEKPEKESRFHCSKISTNRVNAKSSTDDLSYDRYRRKGGKSRIRRIHDHVHKTHIANNCNVKAMFTSKAGSNAPFEMRESNGPANVHENLSAHAIKNLCNIVYNKYCDASKFTLPSDLSAGRDREKVVPEKLFESAGAEPNTNSSLPTNSDLPFSPPAGLAGRAQSAKNKSNSSSAAPSATCAKRMNVSYISSALETWQDDSEQEFAPSKNTHEHEQKRDQHLPHYQPQEAHNNSGHISNTTDAKNKTKHSIEEKIKYLKYLAKRKNVDESDLWANILSQAHKHIRSSDDTVSIQLPSMVSGPDMSELELTLSKLHEIAVKSRVKTPVEVKFQVSSEHLPQHTSVPPKRNKSPEDPRRHFVAR